MAKNNKAQNYKGATIIRDMDSDINYETNNFAKSLFNFILTPILNLLPSSAQKYVRNSHRSANEVIKHATTHEAIEHIYNSGISYPATSLREKISHRIWFFINNSKAVRNRLKLVKKELRKTIKNIISEKNSISLLSIASGSARAVLESLPKRTVLRKCKVRFLDKNIHAIEYSKKLARPLNGACDIDWIHDTANNFPKHYAQPMNIDIIEMVGLLDYFSDEKVIKIFTTIYNSLSDGGYLITSNINTNFERPFITKVVGWKMIYRNAKKMIELAIGAGFKAENIVAYYEPMKIHEVLVLRK